MKVNIHFLNCDFDQTIKSEFKVQGILIKNENNYTLKFFEPENIKVIIEYNKNKTKITRNELSTLEFINNEPTLYKINTPYGLLNININTTYYEVTNDYINIEYYVDNDKDKINRLRININKVDNI